MLQCAGSIFRLTRHPHAQPYVCSTFFCFARIRASVLATVGSLVSHSGRNQCLRQRGVQRRLCALACVCRWCSCGGSNRFESAAISFAGIVVRWVVAAGLWGIALAAGGRLAHAGRFVFVQFQPLCPPCDGVGRLARPGALGRCGMDTGLVGFGRGVGKGKWEIQSTVLS